MVDGIRTETVIYGGAFNPPTVAHQVILQKCVDYAQENGADVWLLPSGDRTDKKITVSRETRLAYLDAMIADLHNAGVKVEVLTTELDRAISVETYDTALELAEAYPERSFTWVFGADSTETMLEWKEGQWLLDNVDMLLIERPGSKVNPAVKNWSPLYVPSMDVSSTELRRRVAAGEAFEDMVSPSVYRLLTS